jgi:hypothetical protein
MITNGNWKPKVLVTATLLGAGLGLLTGYLLNRTADDHGGAPPKVSTIDAIRLAIGVIGLIRGIAALGDRD